MEKKELIESFKTEIENIKAKISELRKKGFDTKIIEIKIMGIPSKIKIAEVTEDEKDIEKVNNMLNDVRQEINDIILSKDLSKELKEIFKKEKLRIEQKDSSKDYESLSKIEILSRVNKLIKDSLKYLDDRKYYEALHLYVQIKDIYKFLPREIRKIIYKDCADINDRLLKSGLFKTYRRRFRLFNLFVNIFKKSA